MSTPKNTLDMISEYWPSEQREIMKLKRKICASTNDSISIEKTIKMWELDYAKEWRKNKLKKDVTLQILEIEAYKSKNDIISWEDAAKEWIGKYGQEWRINREKAGN